MEVFDALFDCLQRRGLVVAIRPPDCHHAAVLLEFQPLPVSLRHIIIYSSQSLSSPRTSSSCCDSASAAPPPTWLPQESHTTEGWPVTSRDTAFAAVNLQPVNTNKTEEKFAVKAVAKGWSVTKRGWPDYLCWSGDEVMCVEVKPEGQDLSPYQKLVMQKLTGLGLKCYRWSPVKGFVKL